MLRFLLASSVALTSLGCGDPEPMCTTDTDCPVNAVCLEGDCRLVMTDSGPRVDSGPEPIDSGPDVDSGPGGPPPPRPVARWPMNGSSTGSIHGSILLPEPALTPLFAWEASEGAERYEIQVTDECMTPGFRDCAFAAPAVDESVMGTTHRTGILPVSTTPPVGARYFWRVRACNASCSSWSSVRYVDVGRQPNDFDGDGYADLLAGAYSHGATNAGRAYSWAGTSTGPGPRTAIDSPTGEDEGRFGLELAALGDVNADGYADAVISCHSCDVSAADAGAAYVFLGSEVGLDLAAPITLAPVTEASASFSRSVAPAGDVNGDGFADLIVGAHGFNGSGADLGRVFVFHGSSTGVDTTPATVLDPPDTQDSQQFGFPVAGVGDVDGDGFADLLVSERLWDGAEVDVGRAHLYAGTASGASSSPARTFVDPEPSAAAETGRYLAGIGDVNGDYFADLIVGARLRLGMGGALVYLGSSRGPGSSPDAVLVPPEMQAAAGFAFAVGGIGDVNGDGLRDVLIGARLFDNGVGNEGRVYLYNGTRGDFPLMPDAIFDATPVQSGQQFGYAVDSAGDVNGDGIHDVLIGAPNHDDPEINEGAVFFYPGGGGALSTSATRLASGTAGAQLGIGVATIPSW